MKRFLSVFLLLLAFLIWASPGARADGTVAKVTYGNGEEGTEYASLQDAFDAISGKTFSTSSTGTSGETATIQLQQDVSESVTTPAGGNVTLDLNGKTITGGLDVSCALTISDTAGSGQITAGDGQKVSINGQSCDVAVYVKDGASVNITGGTISSTNTNTCGVYALGDAKVNVSSGTFSNASSDIYAVDNASVAVSDGTFSGATFGIYAGGNASVDISGGTFNSKTTGVYAADNSSVNVSEGTFSGATNGIYALGKAQVNISGGTISNNTYGIRALNTSSTILNNTKINISGGTIDNASYGIYVAGIANVAISGGTINKVSYYGVYALGTASVDISGGEITNSKCGIVMVQQAGGNISGGTIRNNTYGIWAPNSSTATNSTKMSISGGEIANNTYGIYAVGQAQIQFTQLSLDKLTVSGDKLSSSDFGDLLSGEQQVTSSDVKITNNKYGVMLLQGPTFTMSGGYITSNEYYGIWAPNITNGDKNSAKITISGGKILDNHVTKYDQSAAIQISGTCSLDITGGTISSDQAYGVCVFDSADVTISGSADISAHYFGLATNGNKGQDATVKIDGGKIGSTGAAGIYQPSGKLTITSGEISGQTGIYFKSNSLNISGGTITGNMEHSQYKYWGNGSNATGDALVLDFCGYPNGIGDIQITGGKFISTKPQTTTDVGTKGVGVYVYTNGIKKPPESADKFISGGIFITDPKRAFSDDVNAKASMTINSILNSTSINVVTTEPLSDDHVSIKNDKDNYYYVVKKGGVAITPTANTLTYTGAAQELITEGFADGKLLYATSTDTTAPAASAYSTDIPAEINAGKYYVWYKVSSDSASATDVYSLDVTIAPAAVIVTAPTAKTDLKYTGEALELINAGKIEALSNDTVALLYALDGETYSSEIPTGIEAKTYTISYKPEDNPNYKSVEAASIEATIGKAQAEVTVTGNSLTYNGAAQELVTASASSFSEVLYSVNDGEYSSGIPTAKDAGEYTVSYKIEGTDDYTGKEAASVTATISKLDTASATAEDVGSSKGSAATSAVTVGDYTSSQTLTTTAISLYGVQVLSVDVAITVVSMDDEKDFAITTIGEFSRTVSVDVKLDFNSNFDASSYSSYVYSMDVTGLPEGITVSGTLSSTDEEIHTEYHHVFTISGTPATAGSNLVDMLATITISGDAPALVATASKDISIDVTYEAPTLTGLAATINDAAVTASRGTASSTPLGVTVTGSYNDGSTATLEAGSYSVAWTTASVDVEGISLDNAGNLSVTAIAPLGTYALPVAVTVTTGELSAQASGVVTITVSNAAPELGVYATVSNASGDTSDSTGNIIARVGDSVDIRVYDTRSTEDTTWTGEGTLPDGLVSSDSAYSFRITGAISLAADLGTYKYTVTALNDLGSADVEITIRVEAVEGHQLIVAIDEGSEVITVTADADTILSMSTEKLIEKLTSTISGSGGTGSETTTAKLVLTSDVEVTNETLSALVEKLNDTGVQNIELDLSSVVGLTEVDLSSTKNTSITTLTIGSENTEIKSVNVENNSVITTVNLAGSGVREVKANGSTITKVDVEGCADLVSLDISETEVSGQLSLKGCESLKTLNTGGCGNLTSIEGLEDCAETLTELDVSENSLLELNLRGFKQLQNPKLYGQKRNNWVQMRRFSLWDFFRSLSMWLADDEETGQTENYANKVTILSAEDAQGAPVTWTVDSEGNVEFSRLPASFKYDFDTGLAQTEVGSQEFIAAANEMMDVTISSENPEYDDPSMPGSSSGGGGCNAGFGLLALAAMAFAKRKN